jgi:CelD/BcsL family acetyltransferase involved in cellulose biosynthesis
VTAGRGSPPKVTAVDPCRDVGWEALVHDASGTLFSSPPWLRAIEATYELPVTAPAVASDSGSSLVAGLVATDVDDVLGHRIVGTPFCDFCDLLGSPSPDLLGALLAGPLSDNVPIKLRLLNPPDGLDQVGFRTVAEDWWHGVALQRDHDEMWSSLGSTGRRNVKKARAAGVTIRFDASIDAVDTFFDMHLGTRRAKHGMLAQPRRFFHHIWDQFSGLDAISVALAEHEGIPLAGLFLLSWNGRTYYKFNASTPSGLAMRPNDLLMWETMQWGREQGSELLDLGLSDADQPGLVRYKQKYATEEGRVATVVAGPGRSPQASELLAVFGEVTSVLTDERVPEDVAERVSDALYRYFT